MSSKRLIILLLLVIFNILSPHHAFAEGTKNSNEECFACHGKKGLKINWLDQKIDISVDKNLYNNSVHRTYNCTTCHTEITETPHLKTVFGSELAKKINERCISCHKDIAQQYTKSEHYKLINCSDCHGSHNIMKHQDKRSMANRVNISNVCMSCHDGEIKHAYMESFHGKANHLGSNRAASCVDCHGSHSILGPHDPKSMVSKTNIPQTCSKCHVTARANFAEGKEHTLLENKPGSVALYWTFKFFMWLTIVVITLLFIHMELDLYRLLKLSKEGDKNEI